MTDKRLMGGAMPWTGGLSRVTHPMLVPDTDMTRAQNVHFTLDTRKKKRANVVDEYGLLFTAESAESAFS